MRSTLFISLLLLSLRTPALINGLTLQGKADVVRIRLKNGWVCSGAFIDPYTILTAAHCITAESAKDDLQVDRIESAKDLHLDLEVRRLIPHPEYSAQFWPSHDVGVIKTSKNPRFQGNFQLQEHAEGFLREAVLFGCGRTDDEGREYSRTTGENNFFQIGALLFFIGESASGKGTMGKNVSVAPNDSGGPIIEKATGKIVGVMTTTTLKKSFSYRLPTLSTGTSTSVKENLIFIKSRMGE